jgi:hypothetical protein
MNHTFKISAPCNGRKAKIIMDGAELHGVRGFNINSAINCSTEITITFLANVEFDSEHEEKQ